MLNNRGTCYAVFGLMVMWGGAFAHATLTRQHRILTYAAHPDWYTVQDFHIASAEMVVSGGRTTAESWYLNGVVRGEPVRLGWQYDFVREAELAGLARPGSRGKTIKVLNATAAPPDRTLPLYLRVMDVNHSGTSMTEAVANVASYYLIPTIGLLGIAGTRYVSSRMRRSRLAKRSAATPAPSFASASSVTTRLRRCRSWLRRRWRRASGISDPTREWPFYDHRQIVFDFDEATLNDVPIGGDVESLRFLGPFEGTAKYNPCELQYHSLGLCIEYREDAARLVAIHAVYRDLSDKRFSPFSGTLIVAGNAVEHDVMSAEWRDSTFGAATTVDQDESETVLYYSLGSIGSLGSLKLELEIGTDEIMNRLILRIAENGEK